jgi:hypothetical protein
VIRIGPLTVEDCVVIGCSPDSPTADRFLSTGRPA